MNAIVQYVLIRSDLVKELKWPLGAIIAQACHASVAAIHLNYSDSDTEKYLLDLDRMHKIILEIPNEDELKRIETVLATDDIKHKMWIEQPENIATCIALKPYKKETVAKYFKKYKLCNF